MHVCVSYYLDEIAPGRSTGVWREIVNEMTPFRIPALALVSGLLLSRRIREGWSTASLRRSVLTSAWLYVVWLAMFLLFALAVGRGVWTQQVPDVQSFVQELVLPRTVLWYIFALAVWSMMLAWLRQVHPRLVLALLAGLSVASFGFPGTPGFDHYISIAQHAFMFALGVYGRDRILGLVGLWRTGRYTLIAIGVFAFCWCINEFAFRHEVSVVLTLPQRLAAAFLLISAVRSLCRVNMIRAVLAWVGRRTLPIYVIHPLLIDAARLIPGYVEWMDRAILRTAWPVIVTVVITAIAIAFYELMIRTPGRVMFVVPSLLRDAVTSSAAFGGARGRATGALPHGAADEKVPPATASSPGVGKL